MIDIYTDGASKGNPGPAGWAAIFPDREYSGNLVSTNNIAELEAIHWAIEYTPPGSSIRIYTDSMCCINWLTGIWRCHQPQARFLLNHIHWLKEKKDLHCVIKHIKGHSGDPGNERADRLASLEARIMKGELARRRFWANQEGTDERSILPS